MIIKIRKLENHFAQIDNRVLGDIRLSWKARGILAYLLSKPPNWSVRSEDVTKHGTDGRDAVRSAFAELAKAGYAVLVNTRSGREWHIYDAPQKPSPEKPFMAEPSPENPRMGFANMAKPATSNTDILSKTENRNGVLLPVEDWKPRLAAIYGRRKGTAWSASELTAYARIRNAVDEHELAMVERYYGVHRKKPENYCRRELLTFLRHYQGEVDKARDWCEKHPVKGTRTVRASKVFAEPPVQPETPEERAARERLEIELAERKQRRTNQ